MATIKDVAKLAGVNISTVSRTLSGKIPVDEKTKEKVLQAVKELGYHPNALAQGLKEGKTKTVGLIIPNIRSAIFPAVARGVEDVARKNGYTVILCNTDEDVNLEIDYINKLKKRFVDGLIFATATTSSEHIFKLKEEGFPIVLMVRHLGEKIDAVVINNFDGAYEATNLLIQKGCRNIALINGDISASVFRERFEGYKMALEDNGILLNEEMIVQGVFSGFQNGYNAAMELLEKNKNIDAVFATTDPTAIGAIRAIKDKNFIVGEDIKVIGFVGLEMSEMVDPPLTTMTQPTYEMGAKAMEKLINLMQGDANIKPEIEKLNTVLTIRRST